MNQKRLTTEEAVRLSKSRFWLKVNDYEIALFQLSFEKLCMPWNTFHETVEYALDKDDDLVSVHDFRNL